MALSYQKFREIVLQLLYSHEIANPDEDLMLDLMMTELAVSKRNVRLAQEKVKKIVENLSKIDPLITSVSTSYDFDRIQLVVKQILRLGVFELFFNKEEKIPEKVVIAEAIRLSRKFSAPESGAFVNAILDNLYQTSLGFNASQQTVLDAAVALIETEEVSLKKMDDVSTDAQFT